jgi:hypothetical protein
MKVLVKAVSKTLLAMAVGSLLGGRPSIALAPLQNQQTKNTANPEALLKPEGQEISLQGTIRLIHGYGPPGYGEDPRHDTHVSYWALEVTLPVNTPCTPTKPEYAKEECEAAKRINLFFDGLALTKLTDLPAAKWKDRLVTVRGKLHRADTAGEMTPIYMDVSQINGLTPSMKAAR